MPDTFGVKMAQDEQLRAQGWTREQELDYADYQDEQFAVHECEEVNGVTGPCAKCGQFSVAVSYVTTLGYPGHPGEEKSALEECINPECQHRELAG